MPLLLRRAGCAAALNGLTCNLWRSGRRVLHDGLDENRVLGAKAGAMTL
jgi:hypothetical protein